MANPLHVEWLKEGVERWNARREAARLHDKGLSYEHTGVAEPNESLLRPDLEAADLQGAHLREVNLQGANLQRAYLPDARLQEATLQGAYLQDAKLHDANLLGANLQGAILQGANLKNAIFIGANLAGAYMIDTSLQRANLKNADLTKANLLEADLLGANLGGANLLGAYLLGTNLGGTNLRGAKMLTTDLRSVKDQRLTNDQSRWRSINLINTFGLTQEMLNDAKGDSGVILPEGLEYPDHWPELENEATEEQEDGHIEIEEAHDLNSPFVFLSYSHDDRSIADQVHPLLLKQNMPVWWDADLVPGQTWAAEIKQHLDDAAAVLVLWTKNSVNSASVIEEARQAQSRGALVHAKMDDAELPYGFSETQYADLRNWDGSADHPEMKKLLQALRDKLSPPGVAEIGDRLVSNSSIGTQIEDGKISFADTPVGVEPPMHNPDELAARTEGQIDTADDLIEQSQAYESNAVPENFEFLITRYKNKLSSDKLNWFNLNNSMEVIKKLLSRESYRETWEESLADLCDLLISEHSGLEPFIRPEQLPEDSPERKPDAPDPIVSRTSDIPFEEGAEHLELVVSSEETSEVLDEQASEALQEQTQELNENFAEFKNPTDTKDNKGGPLRRSIKKVAAYVAVTIGAIASGITINVLTAPAAAKTLMANLQTFLDLLLKLF